MHVPYLCPICSNTLDQTNNAYRCVLNHCFDVAKEGYVNLLPVQNKKSKDPGDNKSMIKARDDFLSAGYYQEFCDAVVAALAKHSKETSTLLDIGCGTGWYTKQAYETLGLPTAHGIDISKHAVRLAAKACKDIRYSVASAYALPFPENSFDSALCIFSPIDLVELERTLKPGGLFVFAEPGPTHLYELAALIYEKVDIHHGDERGRKSIPSMQELHSERCQYHTEIKGEDIGNLLAMTPYYWTVSEAKKEEILALENLTVQLDFKIRCTVKR